MRPIPPEIRKPIMTLALGCIAILVALGLLTHESELALFVALTVEFVGLFVIAPWKSR